MPVSKSPLGKRLVETIGRGRSEVAVLPRALILPPLPIARMTSLPRSCTIPAIPSKWISPSS